MSKPRICLPAPGQMTSKDALEYIDTHYDHIVTCQYCLERLDTIDNLAEACTIAMGLESVPSLRRRVQDSWEQYIKATYGLPSNRLRLADVFEASPPLFVHELLLYYLAYHRQKPQLQLIHSKPDPCSLRPANDN